jgi:acyl-CoA synthetase (AMP-forming)/AMP-acid ligase II
VQHEDVEVAAVVGVADERWGEVPVAYVTVADGVDAASCEERLTVYLEERLARFKQPRRYVMVADMPRNSMGKVDKAELKLRAGAAEEAS